MVEFGSHAARGAAFAMGVALHQLLFRFGEWDLQAIRVLGSIVALNIASAVTLMRLIPEAYHSLGTAASETAQLTSFAILGIYTSILVYRAFFHRLNRFPGPFAARLSNIYPTYLSAKRLHLYEETERLHKKYGDYVRLGPRELSITDPKASAIIHAPTSPCTKGPFYDALRPLVSLHMCRNRPEHARRRKVWDRGFTAKALKDYEPRVANYTDQLMKEIEKREGQPMDMSQWFNFYSFDVMGDLAFGKSFGMLQRGKTHYFMSSLHGFMKNVGLLSHLLWLFPIFKNTPILNSEEKQFWVFVNQQVDERRKMTPDRPDVFSWILEEFESKETHSLQDRMDLVGDAYLIVVAGSDTTAATLTTLFFMLATHPETLKKLQVEVDEYHRANEGLGFESTSLAKLPYLDAVINETLRLHPAVPSGVQRETPAQGLRIRETYIPGGTIVQIPTHSIQRDERNFAEASAFIPERWIEEKELVKNASNFVPFSTGRYSCIGKSLGLMEVRRVAAQLVHTYDVRLAPGQTAEKFLDNKRDTFTLSLGGLELVWEKRRKARADERGMRSSEGIATDEGRDEKRDG